MALWGMKERKLLANLPLTVAGSSGATVAFSSDGKTLAAGYGINPRDDSEEQYVGGVILWDVIANKLLQDQPLTVKEGAVKSVSFSRAGNKLAAAYYRNFPYDTGVVVWKDMAARERFSDKLKVNRRAMRGVAFSPDCQTLAAGYGNLDGGGADGGVVLWNVTSSQRLTAPRLIVNEGAVWSVAFSRDGNLLAAGYGKLVGDRDSGVVLWKVKTGERLGLPLKVKEGTVKSVSFSPDGNFLAAGYTSDRSDGGVVLWDLAKRQRLGGAPVIVNEGGVSSVAFDPDGKTLAVGQEGIGRTGRVGGVVFCDLDPDTWIRLARKIANRNLTREEWRQYFPDEPFRKTFEDLPLPPE